MNSRIEYIDLFRGIGILLMILGHLGLGQAFDHYIHAFHMPMFFVVSGFFFRSKKYDLKGSWNFVLKKARSLLVPYAVFGLIYWIMYIVLDRGNIFEPLKHLLFVNTEKLPLTGALWFLTALFVTEIVYHLLDNSVSNGRLKTLFVIILALAGNFFPRILPFRLPYAMDVGLVGVGLFHLGHLFKEGLEKKHPAAEKVFNANAFVCLVVLVISAVLVFLNGYVNQRSGVYGFIPLFWVNAVVITFAGLNLCRKAFVAGASKCRYLFVPLLHMGKNSIVFLCTNEVLIRGLDEICHKLFNLSVCSQKAIIFVISMACMFLAEKVLTNTRLKILIGRK